MAQQKSNLRGVAKAAGVSVTTASRVLNGSDIPTEDTRQKVLKAAGELNYKLDPEFGKTIREKRHGKTTPRKKTGLIGLFMPARAGKENPIDGNDHYGRGISSIQQAISDSNCHMLLQVPNSANDIFSMAQERELDGLLLWRPFKEEDKEGVRYLCTQYPTVLIESQQANLRADSVMLNAGLAMTQQLEYLWELGHRQIAYFETGSAITQQRLRISAFFDFFKDKGVASPVPQLNTPRDIYPAINEIVFNKFIDELLNTSPRPTALAACSVYALPLMNLLLERGIKVPEDISVLSVNDDWRGGHLSRPALTAYHMPIDELGQYAVELLMSRIKKPTMPPRHLQIDGHPLERASCAFINDPQQTIPENESEHSNTTAIAP